MPTDVNAPAPYRAIFCHFDSYSAALNFASWPERCLLWPSPLPEGATQGPIGLPRDGEAARQAMARTLGLPDTELVWAPDYDQGLHTAEGEIRVHLLRSTAFEPPTEALEAAGGVFKPISALRGYPPVELALVREVFNLIVGGAGHRA
ncbi:hypothetical protein [Ideonella dechloratans]|uniref:hypothetical protein n=1 Tax=Ideonella dechloratans TaxID=36863 RepID=UPI0035ADE8D0